MKETERRDGEREDAKMLGRLSLAYSNVSLRREQNETFEKEGENLFQ